MLQIPVSIGDIKDEAFDVIAAALFEGVERNYTTDWAVTGPIIEALGVTLNYQGPSEVAKLVSGNIDEHDFDWMAQYGDAYESAKTPLIAAIKAIAVGRLGEEMSLPISHNKVAGFVKDEFSIIGPLLEGSNCHSVEPGERINTYIFTAKEGDEAQGMFIDLTNLVEQLKDLTILEKDGTGRLLVEHF